MATEELGEPDLAGVAAALGDPRRIKILYALADGAALPASRLATEAGVSASTVSTHLAGLLANGLVRVEPQGRFRFYRLAGDDVEGILEALARVAPRKPVTSLREHTRSAALRTGRTCYRHLAGRLGVDLFAGLLRLGWIGGGDGRHDPTIAGDRLSAPGHGDQYRLTVTGTAGLAELGVDPDPVTDAAPLRYCVDWTEQRHHLAGRLGAAIADRLLERDWVRRGTVPRSVRLTQAGETGLDRVGLVSSGQLAGRSS
ncbi:ArsR/SmtB family transcription factor [Microlunatus speluncae]|uniref:ArsR/SmtB family transcription factor n=1 Tax=Microlunatus speluncae TaxID=2594267 RepID=UPI0012667E81|nr:metalloregulator ArsR/SmtB family transcription factor [Microlunatus speluncae]